MHSYPWLEEIQKEYGLSIDTIESLGSGHIHRTYKVFSKGEAFVLQEFNSKVFANPDRISHNHSLLLNGLSGLELSFNLPLPILNINDQLFTDKEGVLFRLSPFIEGVCLDEVAHSNEARLAAQAFAALIASCSSIEANNFKETISDFHNLQHRFLQLQEACANTKRTIYPELQELIDFYLAQHELVMAYQSWVQRLPLRVTHNDTKINNLIFSLDRKKVSAVIDLDTIMAGFAFYDFGDLVRTVACTKPESSTDWSEIGIDEGKYQSLWEGFLEGGKGVLTDEEIESLPFGGKMMTCIMGFRFLTDYLNGNLYYSISYEEQNFHRAKNQMILLKSLEQINFRP